ncbi:hypothetical protein K501DRAFT_280732 [Backusella circina FSU 941]|nr:hypothetical protein K501DRAFT_280732 [Backusella circina FSU 941]
MGQLLKFFDYNGFLQFLELTGPLHSAMSLYYLPSNVNAPEILDNRNCRMSYFSLKNCIGNTALPNLVKFNQSKYVKEFTIMMSDIESYHHFQNLTALTKLDLETIV